MGKANAADAMAIKLIDCPEYAILGELKQALLRNLPHKVLEIGQCGKGWVALGGS